MTTDNLSEDLKHLAAALRRIEHRLREEHAPEQSTLNEFRQAVDNVRLTAWSVSELINAERVKKNPNTVLAFLSAERIRRFDQLVKNLCGDIERQALTFETQGMPTLIESVNMLQQRLLQCSKEGGKQAYKSNGVAR